MKIAIVTDTYPPQVNGVARTLGRTANAMRRRGHEVLVVTTSDPAATADSDTVRFAGKPFWLYPQLQFAFPGKRAMARTFESWKPDVVHVATPFGVGLAARAAARRAGIPLVSSYHTSFSHYARHYGFGGLAGVGWRFLRWFHNGTLKTLVPTRAIGHELEQHGFAGVGLWKRGVDTKQFDPRWRSESLRGSWAADSRTTVIAYVGRLAAEKGLDVALAAMRTICRERGDVVFVIVGDGPYELACRQQAPPGTIFAGYVSDGALGEVYASADIFLFPSTTDTFGNVVQEAMASGLVVVGADVPQTREVAPADCAAFFRPGDATSLTATLRALLRSPEEVTARRARSVEAMRGRSWDAVFDQLERDYEEVASTPISRTSKSENKGSAPRADPVRISST